MRVVDLIRPGHACRLRHPTVGDVLWTHVPMQGFELVFARGREKGEALVPDESVLLDDGWTIVADDKDDGDDPERKDSADRAESEPLPDPTAVASRKALAAHMERLRGTRLDRPALWAQPAAEFLSTLELTIGSADCWPEAQRFGIATDAPSWSLFAWVMCEAIRASCESVR